MMIIGIFAIGVFCALVAMYVRSGETARAFALASWMFALTGWIVVGIRVWDAW